MQNRDSELSAVEVSDIGIQIPHQWVPPVMSDIPCVGEGTDDLKLPQPTWPLVKQSIAPSTFHTWRYLAQVGVRCLLGIPTARMQQWLEAVGKGLCSAEDPAEAPSPSGKGNRRFNFKGNSSPEPSHSSKGINR